MALELLRKSPPIRREIKYFGDVPENRAAESGFIRH
jgi:hypothetical protein